MKRIFLSLTFISILFCSGQVNAGKLVIPGNIAALDQGAAAAHASKPALMPLFTSKPLPPRSTANLTQAPAPSLAVKPVQALANKPLALAAKPAQPVLPASKPVIPSKPQAVPTPRPTIQVAAPAKPASISTPVSEKPSKDKSQILVMPAPAPSSTILTVASSIPPVLSKAEEMAKRSAAIYNSENHEYNPDFQNRHRIGTPIVGMQHSGLPTSPALVVIPVPTSRTLPIASLVTSAKPSIQLGLRLSQQPSTSLVSSSTELNSGSDPIFKSSHPVRPAPQPLLLQVASTQLSSTPQSNIGSPSDFKHVDVQNAEFLRALQLGLKNGRSTLGKCLGFIWTDRSWKYKVGTLAVVATVLVVAGGYFYVLKPMLADIAAKRIAEETARIAAEQAAKRAAQAFSKKGALSFLQYYWNYFLGK